MIITAPPVKSEMMDGDGEDPLSSQFGYMQQGGTVVDDADDRYTRRETLTVTLYNDTMDTPHCPYL